MFKRFVIAGAVATMCSVGALAQTPPTGGSQQTPPAQPGTAAPTDQQRPTTPPAATRTEQAATVTLSGCLVREQDVAGRQPNPAERAGVLEDYILTEAKMASAGATGSTGSTSTGSATAGTTGAAGASASRNISEKYKVEGIPDERLSAMVGKRVEIVGRIDADDQREIAGTTGAPGAAPATPRSADDDMPEFEAASIREVPGTCDSK